MYILNVAPYQWQRLASGYMSRQFIRLVLKYSTVHNTVNTRQRIIPQINLEPGRGIYSTGHQPSNPFKTKKLKQNRQTNEINKGRRALLRNTSVLLTHCHLY